MANTYNGTLNLTGTWQDLAATYTAMANASAWVQNGSTAPILVAFSSSASAPTGGGLLLQSGELVAGTAAHCWARCLAAGATATVALGLTD